MLIYRIFVVLCFIAVILYSCKLPDTGKTCSERYKDGDWDDIIEDNECPTWMRGAAYLGKAEFNYFLFALPENQGSIVKPLLLEGKSKGQVSEKLSNFRLAAKTVRNVYQSGNDQEKSVFLLGSFLAFFTDFTLNMDNGEATGDRAFDGTITTGEVNAFTGVSATTGTGDGTDITTSTLYQLTMDTTSDGKNYIWNSDSNKFFQDVSNDGLPDESLTEPDLILELFTQEQILLGNINPFSKVTAAKQIMYINSITNPLNGSDDKIDDITEFINKIISYITDITESLKSLGLSENDENLKNFTQIKAKLDNGGKCELIENNPAILIITLFLINFAEKERTNYSFKNNVEVNELANLQESSASDVSPISSIGVTLGIKFLFKKTDSDFIAYWDGAHEDVKGTLGFLKKFLVETRKVESEDGKIDLPELLCASDLFQSGDSSSDATSDAAQVGRIGVSIFSELLEN